MIDVLESAEFVVRNSRNVTVDEAGCASAARYVLDACKVKPYTTAAWKNHELHPKETNLDTLHWILVIDTLNFSFWSSSGVPFTVKHKGQTYTGYWALCAAVNRAIDEGIPMLSAEFLSTISQNQLQHVFRSETTEPVSMLAMRQRNLQEVGRVLSSKYDGSFANVIGRAGNSAQRLLQIIVDEFPCFADTAEYGGRRVHLMKRAQILIADVWACFNGEAYGAFADIDTITMFADYRVPQMLVYLGAIKYTPALLARLGGAGAGGGGQGMQPGDSDEVEIRAASIWAVELIRRRISDMLPGEEGLPPGFRINAILIDFFLWDVCKARQGDQNMDAIPIHKVRTIFY